MLNRRRFLTRLPLGFAGAAIGVLEEWAGGVIDRAGASTSGRRESVCAAAEIRSRRFGHALVDAAASDSGARLAAQRRSIASSPARAS